MNEMTDGGPLNQVLSRRYGVQGAPAQNVASELFPVIPMAGPGAPPENDYLQTTKRYAFAGVDSATVAATCNVGLRNPSGSGMLVIIDRIVCVNLTGSTMKTQYGFRQNSATTPDASTSGIPADSRWGIGNNSAALVVIFTGAAQGTSVLGAVSDTTQAEMFGPWVLTPGSTLWVSEQDQNADLIANFWWRERAATAGELLGAYTY